MGRLSNIKPIIDSLPPRIGYQPGDQKAQERHRSISQPWRAWYKTARWQRLRRQVLGRDLYTCQKTGVLLYHKHPHPHSPVVDHIKAHHGDPTLFWDEANLQTVSKDYHDSLKQAQERAPPWG